MAQCSTGAVRMAPMRIACCVMMLFAGEALAQQPPKAPAGSKDQGIKAAGYCLGEAQARAGKLKDGLDANSREVKELQSDKRADAQRRDALEVSGVYVGKKMMFLSSEMEWMYKMAQALGSSVQNPDPKVLNEGIARGKRDGDALYVIESGCERHCNSARNADELSSCVDVCATREQPAIASAAKECDRLYANRHQ
jgi:hypothetical protein